MGAMNGRIEVCRKETHKAFGIFQETVREENRLYRETTNTSLKAIDELRSALIEHDIILKGHHWKVNVSNQMRESSPHIDFQFGVEDTVMTSLEKVVGNRQSSSNSSHSSKPSKPPPIPHLWSNANVNKNAARQQKAATENAKNGPPKSRNRVVTLPNLLTTTNCGKC